MISVGSAALGVLWQLVTIVDIEQDGKKLFRVRDLLAGREGPSNLWLRVVGQWYLGYYDRVRAVR